MLALGELVINSENRRTFRRSKAEPMRARANLMIWPFWLNSVDTILLGRVTYQMFAGHWPKITKGKEKPFADKLNSIPKIVFSKTIESAPWGDWEEGKIVKSTAVKEVAKLKRRPGKNMVIWGSISGTVVDKSRLDR